LKQVPTDELETEKNKEKSDRMKDERSFDVVSNTSIVGSTNGN